MIVSYFGELQRIMELPEWKQNASQRLQCGAEFPNNSSLNGYQFAVLLRALARALPFAIIEPCFGASERLQIFKESGARLII